MQSSNPKPARKPNWRRRMVMAAILGSSALYCLGIGAFLVKRQLLAAADSGLTGGVVAQATLSPGTGSLFARPTTTLEPTPTDAPLAFPTALTPAPLPSPTQIVANGTPTAVPPTPATAWPTPIQPTPATATPQASATPTVAATPTAQATATPTLLPTPSPTPSQAKPSPTPSRVFRH